MFARSGIGRCWSRFLSISESEFRRYIQGFRKEGIEQNHFSQKAFFHGFQDPFLIFLEALGFVLLVCGTLKTGFEIDGFLVWTRISSPGSRDADLSPIWALRTDNSIA